MTGFQRLQKILFSILMILVAIILMFDHSDDACTIVIGITALGIAISGIKDIIFYFSMARQMVGGKMVLLQGVITLDFGMFTASLSDVPKSYIILYLIGIHIFAGAVEILRAMESKKTVEGPWKLKFSHGVINVLLALICLAFIKNPGSAMMVYGASLIYSAIVRIIIACRKTAFIVIK